MVYAVGSRVVVRGLGLNQSNCMRKELSLVGCTSGHLNNTAAGCNRTREVSVISHSSMEAKYYSPGFSIIVIVHSRTCLTPYSDL